MYKVLLLLLSFLYKLGTMSKKFSTLFIDTGNNEYIKRPKYIIRSLSQEDVMSICQ